mmetsp:Transcript_23573/g.33159  ORF Transcript_23573/g.33159 Transcript_23573/m.33159 type:complete len:210 (-) Transcript_23573:26-655(-)
MALSCKILQRIYVFSTNFWGGWKILFHTPSSLKRLERVLFNLFVACELSRIKNYIFIFFYFRSYDGVAVRSDLGPDFGALFSDGTSDSGTLHFTLRSNDDTGIVFTVDEDTIFSSPGLSLSDNDGLQDLLSEFGFTLLDRSQDHITRSGVGQLVQTTSNSANGDNVKILGTGIVSAVKDGTLGETDRNLHLGTDLTTSSSFGHGYICVY